MELVDGVHHCEGVVEVLLSDDQMLVDALLVRVHGLPFRVELLLNGAESLRGRPEEVSQLKERVRAPVSIAGEDFINR